MLYRTHPNAVIEYWDARLDGRRVTVHTGPVGEPDSARISRPLPGENPDAHLLRLRAEAAAAGFAELPDDAFVQLQVQWQVQGWGSTADLEFRHQVEDDLDACLKWTGNGCCDGGDIGSGTLNVFCFVVAVPAAIQSVLGALEAAERPAPHSIAIETADQFVIAWPPELAGSEPAL